MDAETIINRLGGTSAVARLCEIRTAAVSQWKRKGIPPARRQYLQLLRPDVFQGTSQRQDKQEAA